MTKLLTEDEFGAELGGAEHTLFRLELQDGYLEPCEAALFAAWDADRRCSPVEVPELVAWYHQVATQWAAGIRVERVRVQQEPPTRYQQFEHWLDPWNLRAGETIRYLTVSQAHRIGLLPAAGGTDWWLLDSARLIVMHFDDEGHRIRNELTTDPAAVVQACKWRDLAVHHATGTHTREAAA